MKIFNPLVSLRTRKSLGLIFLLAYLCIGAANHFFKEHVVTFENHHHSSLHEAPPQHPAHQFRYNYSLQGASLLTIDHGYKHLVWCKACIELYSKNLLAFQMMSRKACFGSFLSKIRCARSFVLRI